LTPSLERRLAALLALGGLVLILTATLTPIPRQAPESVATPFLCLVCGPRGAVDVVLNILLFIPFAFGLARSGVATRRVIVASVLLTMLVEFLQYIVVTGRDSSLSDLLTNSLGGTLGATLAARTESLIRPTPATARRLAIAWAAAWLGVMAATALALRPWAPAGPFLVRWAHARPPRPPIGAKVVAASLGNAALSEGRHPARSKLTGLIRTGTTRLRLSVVTGKPPAHWRSILTLSQASTQASTTVVLGLSQSGQDLVFEVPSQASPLKFNPMAIRLNGAFPTRSGVPLDLAAEIERQTVRLTSSYDGGRSRSLGLSPSFGWSLVLPFDYTFGPEVHLLTGLWLAGFMLPLGFWWGRAELPVSSAIARMTGVVVFGLGGLPLLTGYPPVHWSEWAASAMGVALGWARSRRAAYLPNRCDSPSIGAFS
jgi:hypothetical protein